MYADLRSGLNLLLTQPYCNHFHSCAGPPILRRARKGGGMQDKVVYLTAEGKHRFTAELHQLVTVRRHEIEEQIRHAKEFSDAVDNAEYEEAKTEQAFVEGRIQELERLL